MRKRTKASFSTIFFTIKSSNSGSRYFQVRSSPHPDLPPPASQLAWAAGFLHNPPASQLAWAAGFLEKPPASQLGCIPDPKTPCVPVRVKPPQRNFTQQLRRFHPFATVAKDPTAMPDFPLPT